MARYYSKTLLALGNKYIFPAKLTRNYQLCLCSSARNFSQNLSSYNFGDNGKQLSSSWQNNQSDENASSEKNLINIIRTSDVPLARDIVATRNVTALLSLIGNVHLNDVDARIFEITTECFSNHLKIELSPSVKESILSSTGMQKYCRLVKEQVGSVNTNTLIVVCEIFVMLNTPGDHATFQNVQRLLSRQLNAMSLSNIMFLDSLIEKMDPISQTPLTETLRLALPMIFESQLKLQLSDVKSVKNLVECLTYAVSHDLSENVVQEISKALSQSLKNCHYHDAFSLLLRCGEVSHDLPVMNEILSFIFKSLAANIRKLNSKEVGTILTKCAKNVLNGKDSWYDLDLIDACCQRLVEIGDDSILSNLTAVSRLRHVNVDFLEAVADIAVKNRRLLLNDETIFLNIIRAFSGANYKPEKWNLLCPLLAEHPALTKDVIKRDIPLALDYLALDMLPDILVGRIFSPNYDDTLDEWFKKGGSGRTLIISAAIKTFYPEYDGPLPSDQLLKEWESQARMVKASKRRSLEGALQKGLGGKAYLLSCMFYQGIFIDHCVIMQDGYPVAFNNFETSNVDDIVKPVNSSLILIKSFDTETYARNTSRLRGVSNLEYRILKSSGHVVVEVDLASWYQVLHDDKIPWLMDKISSKYKNSTL